MQQSLDKISEVSQNEPAKGLEDHSLNLDTHESQNPKPKLGRSDNKQMQPQIKLECQDSSDSEDLMEETKKP